MMTIQAIAEMCKKNEKDLFFDCVNALDSIRFNYNPANTNENYIFHNGTDPILLITHLDTVAEFEPDTVFIDPVEQVAFAGDVLGMDDRAGIAMILEIWQRGFDPSILIVSGEEVGGIGIRRFLMDYPQAPQNIKYIIELDRRGFNDAVFYRCYNKKFIDYVTSFGFEEAQGTFSDISIIAPEWKIAAANLSVGYMYEHTEAEHFYYKWWTQTLIKVINMIEDLTNVNRFKYIERNFKKHGGYCWRCGKFITKKDGAENNFGQYICYECQTKIAYGNFIY